MMGERGTLIAGALARDSRSIARAISVVEAEGDAAADVIKGVFRRSGRAFLLGVTGAPGVGKSSLVDRLVAAVRQLARTVAVLAIDPSSPFSGGAVLGDRVRMQAHDRFHTHARTHTHTHTHTHCQAQNKYSAQ